MTKSDLKNGLIIKTRYGRTYLVVDDKGIGAKGYIDLNNFNEDLTVKRDVTSNDDFDIMEVHHISGNSAIDAVIHPNYLSELSCIWRREDVVEMTVDEIKKKLGIQNLKIIKEKNNE